MAPRRVWLLLALPVTAAIGCNWKEFDDTLAKAPVLSVGPGDDYKARDVGKVVLPLTVPAAKKDKVAARYLVAGTETPSLAVVDLDANGQPRTHVATGTEIMDMAGEAKAAVKSAVELEDGRVLLGTPAYNTNPLMAPAGRIYFLKLEDKEDDVTFTLTRGNDPRGQAELRPGGGRREDHRGTAQDLVVASQTDVAMAPDGNDAEAALVANKPTCPVNLDDTTQEKYRFRALGVGDLIDGGGDEIAIGVPREGTMPGKVVILAPGEGGLDCPLTITAPLMQPRFGNAVLVTDINGDGKKDLLVGAPPTRAYLYLGPFVAGVAAGPQQGVQAPNADGHPGAGRLRLPGGGGGHRRGGRPGDPGVRPRSARGRRTRRWPGVPLQAGRHRAVEINDNSPSANAGFGFSIQGIRFSPPAGCGTDRPVLLVGADREVFTFFRVPGGPADPRCFK